MMKLALVLFLGAAGGFVAGAATLGKSTGDSPSAAPVAVYFDESAPVDDRLAALERTVAEERNARLVLEEQITLLLEEIDRLDTTGPDVLAPQISAYKEAERRRASVADDRDILRQQNMTQRERQHAALTEGGFTPDRANQLLDRVSALQWELMQENYEARQGGTRVDWSSLERNPEWRLRQELGDAEYERYLNALQRPTEVSVESVMASSPASRAGLANGDVILSYNGTRIFNVAELRSFSMEGGSSGDAVVEILRDGNRMQITVPAGPMGVQIGSRRGGNSRWRISN